MEMRPDMLLNREYRIVPIHKRHLKNIFSCDELEPISVIRKFRTTASDGKNCNTNFYNLDAIISVGYRVRQGLRLSPLLHPAQPEPLCFS